MVATQEGQDLRNNIAQQKGHELKSSVCNNARRSKIEE
jgi:hypothetical protein